MKRRHRIGLVAVLLLVIIVGGAFLTGLGLDGHESASYLDVSRVSSAPADNQTTSFTNLTPDQQQVFEKALTDEDDMVQIPANVDVQVWIENDYVSYQNQTYHVAVAVSG